eukprot:2273104-Pyramimonas_sp.AAC.1
MRKYAVFTACTRFPSLAWKDCAKARRGPRYLTDSPTALLAPQKACDFSPGRERGRLSPHLANNRCVFKCYWPCQARSGAPAEVPLRDHPQISPGLSAQ